jgi:two-component system alkaline phosphatase synthesis response regulator PhoP
MATILVVDDEKPILELLRFNLEREGYEVLTAEDGPTAIEMARKFRPHLIILDVMLPGQDGLTVCRILHGDPRTREIPIIMLSARGEEVDRIVGLEVGADDYVAKPFSPRELVARVKARLRRLPRETPAEEESGAGIMSFGRLVIDEENFAVFVDGIKQDFTRKEFELLRFLARNPGRVFTREYLLERVWDYGYKGDSRTVDVHICRIRQKLEQMAGLPQYITTVRGVGYRFDAVARQGETGGPVDGSPRSGSG